jgi:hypothetical protein
VREQRRFRRINSERWKADNDVRLLFGKTDVVVFYLMRNKEKNVYTTDHERIAREAC